MPYLVFKPTCSIYSFYNKSLRVNWAFYSILWTMKSHTLLLTDPRQTTVKFSISLILCGVLLIFFSSLYAFFALYFFTVTFPDMPFSLFTSLVFCANWFIVFTLLIGQSKWMSLLQACFFLTRISWTFNSFLSKVLRKQFLGVCRTACWWWMSVISKPFYF